MVCGKHRLHLAVPLGPRIYVERKNRSDIATLERMSESWANQSTIPCDPFLPAILFSFP